MRKDKKLEKFFSLTRFSVVIIAVVLLVVYLIMFSLSRNRYKIFFSFIIPAVFFTIFFAYNCLLTYFHKKGAFTLEQAAEFYRKCSQSGIVFSGDTNMEKAKDIYFSVFGTDKYLGENTLLSHMVKIYNAGKEIAEKQ